jgi:hypothetical protein
MTLRTLASSGLPHIFFAQSSKAAAQNGRFIVPG